VGLAKSSLHRALKALRRAGLVEQDHRGPYRLSLQVVRLVTDFYDGFDRRSVVTPALQALAGAYSAAAHYAELDHSEVVYVAKIDATRGVRMSSSIGGRNPAHCTGVGKALLAQVLPDRSSVEQFVAEYGPLVKRTERTLTTAAELAKDFELIRSRGYAIDDRESEEVINCIAFPLYLTSSRRPTGAISVTTLVQHLVVDDLASQASEIRQMIDAHLGPVTQ